MKSYTEQELRELAILLQAGDTNAFNTIFEHYRKAMVLQAYFYLKDNTDEPMKDAEDIVQEISISLWVKRRNITIAEPKSYLLRAVKNSCIDFLIKNSRDKKRLEEQQLPAAAVNTISIIEKEELRQQLRSAIEQLSPARRNAFEEKHMGNKSVPEIAAEMRVNEQTVRNHICEAVKCLRDTLAPQSKLC
jgi:RNA polymerase sigma factor (sigma-70 family)